MTPGQLVMTNTRFQRDSLAQSLPSVEFPQPVPNPLYSPPAIQGTDDTPARPPPSKRPKSGKGSGGKAKSSFQSQHLTEVPTRLETVVKLSGSTCYRAFMLQDACGFLSGRFSRRDRLRQQHVAQQNALAVKRREAYTRANVGFSRAIGTTIIISPLDMAGQPGACIVTAVLQAGFAIVDTNALGASDIVTALDTKIRTDQDMEDCLNGKVFGRFPIPMALCWQRVDDSSQQTQFHRLHLVLTEAPRYTPKHKLHRAYPGGVAIGLLGGYALDGDERPIWEVRPDRDGWQLQHVHGGGQRFLTSQSGVKSHRFWPLHRVHAYDAFGLHPKLNHADHFEIPSHQAVDVLESSSASLLYRHRDVRDDPQPASTVRSSAPATDQKEDTDIITVSDSSVSRHTEPGVHWDSGSHPSSHRQPRTIRLKEIKEENGALEVQAGFPTSDDVEESTVARQNATVAGLAHLCNSLEPHGGELPRFQFNQLAQLPFEWPMARLSVDFPSIASSFAQNVFRSSVETTLQGQLLTDPWIAATCEKFAWEASRQAASVLATLFAGVGSFEVLQRFPAWQLLESAMFYFSR